MEERWYSSGRGWPGDVMSLSNLREKGRRTREENKEKGERWERTGKSKKAGTRK